MKALNAYFSHNFLDPDNIYIFEAWRPAYVRAADPCTLMTTLRAQRPQQVHMSFHQS